MPLSPEFQENKNNAIAIQKRLFASKQMELAGELRRVIKKINSTLPYYFNRDYGNNEVMSDDDLKDFPFTHDQMISFVATLEGIKNAAEANGGAWINAVNAIADFE